MAKSESQLPAKTGSNAMAIRMSELHGLLDKDKFQESLKVVLPEHLTPKQIVKMFFIAASKQPKLFQCTNASVLQSLMLAAELGLNCTGGVLGEAYLIPFYNNKTGKIECQFMPGYRGLIDLARRSGKILRIESRVVYEKDVFDVEYGLNPVLRHKINIDVADRGPIRCVYALAELSDGSKQIEVMTLDEVNGIRARSKAKDGGPWKTDFNEMARKTAIRRIVKYLPMSPDMAKAVDAADKEFDFSAMAEKIAGDVGRAMQPGIEGIKERLEIEGEKPKETPPAQDDVKDEVVEPEVVADPPKDQNKADFNLK